MDDERKIAKGIFSVTTFKKFFMRVTTLATDAEQALVGWTRRGSTPLRSGLLMSLPLAAFITLIAAMLGDRVSPDRALAAGAIAMFMLLVAIGTLSAIQTFVRLGHVILSDWWLVWRVLQLINLELDARLYQRTGMGFSDLESDSQEKARTSDYLGELFGGHKGQV